MLLMKAHHRALRAPSAVPASERSVLNEFTSAWVISKKIQFAGVRPESRGNGDRGMYATYPLAPGVKLASVPASVPITVVAAGEPSANQVPDHVWQQLPWYAQMAVKLLARLQDAGYVSYKAVLPVSVDLPALWEQESVQQLQCPYIIGKITAERAQWQQLATLLQSYVATSQLYWALAVVRSRSFAGPHFSIPMSMKAGLAMVLPATVLLASLASGQSLGVGNIAAAVGMLMVPAALTAWDLQQAQTKVKYTIAPFLDMFNHSSRSTSEVGFDWVQEAYTVSASQSYSAGQQVFISYGELSNDALLQLYGFVEENNPHDRYVVADMGTWLLQGPLLAAAGGDEQAVSQLMSMASPGLFTEVVLTQAGMPSDVRQAVQAIADQLTPSTGQNAAALASEALIHAVNSELQQLGSSLETDIQELQKAQRMVQLAQQGEPQPPLEPQAPVQPIAPEKPAAMEAADGMADQEGMGTATNVAVVMTATATEAAVDVAQAQQQQYEEEMQLYKEQVVQYNAALQQYNQSLEQYKQLHTEWQEARSLGVSAGVRWCTILQYRIEKKRLLQACALQLS